MPVFTVKRPAHDSWPPPPPNSETNEEQRRRLKRETDAKYRSDSIDRQLYLEHEERQRKTSRVKVLLLGQAESGKSTVLKNFQLHLAPKAFELEVELWRPVIQLNLVRSVNVILDFISNRNQGIGSSSCLMCPKLRTLCLRLAPLRRVEEDIVRILSMCAPSEMQQPHSSAHALENAVRNGWKQVITLYRRSEESTSPPSKSFFDAEDHPNRRVLVALGEDIAALWHDDLLQQTLKSAGIALEEQPGFFLDHAIRVTRENYKPRPDDVLRARVTTIGPEEHTIAAEGFNGSGKQWTIYDVGGSRNQRAAWAQYFDDVNAIIFLAPLSGFNQFLDEDESVNRLTDSLKLWQVICSNKFLESVGFVLFLNKMDILHSKLKSGIKFSSYIPSYDVTKPNETKRVTQHLLDVFTATHKQYSPKRRTLHAHLTCAIDTKATASIIKRIQDIILIRLLSQTEIL